ncbi:MAG: cadherin-like domain-containing protein, partial [Verrucomicrobia bacterium]|nr:cadherin-like domain-containing protein [Verrucomicrobiota bacterium]
MNDLKKSETTMNTDKQPQTNGTAGPSLAFILLLALMGGALILGGFLRQRTRPASDDLPDSHPTTTAAMEAVFIPDIPDPQPGAVPAADLVNRVRPAVAAATAPPRSDGVAEILKTREEQPAWAVPYGKEFWRKPGNSVATASASVGAAAARELPGDFSLSDVIDRVSTVFQPGKDGADAEIQAFAYQSRLVADGFVFSPDRPSPSAVPEAKINAEPGASAPGVWRATAREPNVPDPDTQFHVHTTALRRGDLAAALQQNRWSVLGNTAQRNLSADWQVSEHIQAGSAGVEVSWILAAAPPGDGPLLIQSELAGLTYFASTNGVHHFADGSGTARVKMSKVVAVDSAGRHYDLAAKVEGSRLNVIVPGMLLASAAYPLAIDPTLSAEFGIDQPVMTQAADNQLLPQVASDGSGFLVVWVDYRGGVSHIYGARVDAAGTLLDPSGLVICDAAGYQERPRVAWDSQDYLVVWADRRDGSTYNIFAGRVGADGSLPDGAGFAVSASAHQQYEPAVAWNGTDFLVVWRESTGSSTGDDIYGRPVHADGSLAASATVICAASNTQYQPDVALDGTGFMAVWTDYRSGSSYDIYAAKLDATGAVVTGNIPINTGGYNQSEPRVAWNGSQHLVVFRDDYNYVSCYTCCGWSCSTCCNYYYTYRIYGAFVDPSGAVGATVSITPSGTSQFAPAVASNGSDWLVTWRNYDTGSRPYGQRLSSSGSFLGSAFAISTAGISSSPTAAWNGAHYLVAFDSYSTASSYDVFAHRVTAGGTIADAQGITLSFGANTEQNAAVASNGTHYLIAWNDNRNGVDYDIYGARLERDGTVLDPTALPISTASGEQSSPKVASNGADFLVVWQDLRNSATTGYDVYGARVTDGGSVLDPAGVAIRAGSGTDYQPSVASNGSDYMVAWAEYSGASSYDIRGARLSSGGTVLDPSGISVSAASNGQFNPALASDGSNYLVVWGDTRSGDYDIYGARVTGAGVVQDGSGIPISTASNTQYTPAVAYGGGTFLIAWQDYRSGGSYDFYAARVAPDGTLADSGGILLRNTSRDEINAAVAWDGSTFLVAWNRNDPVNLYDCEAVEIGADGIVSAEGAFPISATAGQDRLPAVASGGPGEFLLLYQRSGSDLGGTRIRARLIRSNTPPSAADQNVVTAENVPVDFTLTVSDPDEDALSFTFDTPPAHGSLAGTPPFATYTPGAGFCGTDSFTYTASDGRGGTASATVAIEVMDVSPPVFALPADITAEATGSSGATVNFVASALDTCDGAVPVACTPASGSSFSLGTTTVNCTAT